MGLRLLKIFWIVAFLSIGCSAASDGNKGSHTCCSDAFGLNYTLPMFRECTKKYHANGSMVQTIPKIIPASSVGNDGCSTKDCTYGIPTGHRVCRFPDCEKKPCDNGWCEETMRSHRCHCFTGFQGTHCNEHSTHVTHTQTESTKNRTAMKTEGEAIEATSTIKTAVESASHSCPDLWKSFGNSCYRTFPDKTTFWQALIKCRNLPVVRGQADLVSIHSDEENDFVSNISNFSYAWIGLHQPDPKGPFVWSDGSHLNYTAWRPNQPDNWKSLEHCVRLLKMTDGPRMALWNDRQCISNSVYVCKLTLNM